MRKRRKEVKRVSHCPQGLAFKQQRLKAWQPLWTPRAVLPVFLLFGLLLLPVGAGLLVSQNRLKAITLDYTHCRSQAQPNRTCYDIVGPDTSRDPPCVCSVPFTLLEDIDDQVFIYYRLTHFTQNHRRYVRSRDDHQLRGYNVRPDPDTSPLDQLDGVSYAPAGYISNSMFNDTIAVLRDGRPLPLSAEGINWPSDADTKFRGGLQDTFGNTLPPPNWHHAVYDFPDDGTPGFRQGFTNPDLINWMRVGVLPNFRKLYRLLVGGGLPRGAYTLQVQYRYPVSNFSGRKEVVLATANALGGYNFFLPIAYMVLGSLSLVAGTVLLVVHALAGRPMGDSRYLQWQ